MENVQGVLYVWSMSMSERIREVMKDMTQQQFGDTIGVTAQAVNQWLKEGGTKPSLATMRKIAEVHGVDFHWLATGDEPHKAASEIVFKTTPQTLGERDFPVFAAVEGGKGELVISTDPIEIVQRPWYLGEVRDGYAVVVTGESMLPVYDPGDMLIINPRLPYMRGKDHIFTTNRDDGHFRASVKRLVRVTDKEWIVEQFNPPETISLPRAVWTEAKRVVGKYTG